MSVFATILQESGPWATELAETFGPRLWQGAGPATASIFAIGVGVLLLLLCDIISAAKALKAPVFIATILIALGFQLRILGMEAVPGIVLDGTFVANRMTALWGVLFCLGTLFTYVYSIGYYDARDLPFKAEHDALLLSAPAGMMLMVGAGDLIVFFVGLELLSIPLYALAAFQRSRARSVEAGLKYFLLGSFSSALFLYGAALLYAATGTVAVVGENSLISHALAGDLGGIMGVAGSGLVASSLFFKISAFPFHLWAPDVYEGSPTPVTALMATGTKAAALGVLVNLTHLFPASAAQSIAWLALITMAIGNLCALVQTNLKRMLAYSGIAHAGTVLLIIAGGLAGAQEETAQRAALFYMGAYLFTAMGAFGILSVLEADGQRYLTLDGLRGLARSRPGLAAALTLFMLSLGGIPATGGFLGKWLVFSTLVEAKLYGIAVLGALLSVVALGYYLRILVTLYMQPQDESIAPPMAARPLTAGAATVACAVGVLAMGILPGWFLGLF